LRADDRALASLAQSVADGTPIDWRAAEADAAPRDRRLVRHLRLVESIAALHRSIPASSDPEPAVSRPAPAPEGRRWGRLVLLECIGEGASCEVYRAWDSELHRHVALKLLKPDGSHTEAHGRILEEARRLARLRHEHIVQVYGAEEHDFRVGLWMELVRGTSLEQLVRERGGLGAREAALLGLDVCAALAAVHGAGLLHRDVKAQNVMREEGGRTVLMDFGTGEELAGTARMVGTPLYLAPEIFRGERASVQSDLYSVGVLLFYLVTGTFPVVAGSMEELATAHASRERQPLRDLRSDLSEAFVRVVERALDSDPARRYRSVGELERALRESLDIPSAAAPAPAAARRPRPSAMTAFLVAAAVLLLLVVGLIVWTRNTITNDARPSITRVAVLPLRNMSASPAASYLADELTDQLISTLGQIRSLQVTSLTSVMQFKDQRTPIPEVARQLGVDDVVEATLTIVSDSSGRPDRVRVNARLIAAGTDTQIWSETFERSLGDTLALQAEVARAIAEGISAAVTPDEQRRLADARRSSSAANDAYYLGLHLLSQSSSDFDGAVEAFRRATELDPNHSGARAGLARGLISQGFMGAISQQEARARALAEANRALALDGDSAEAHAVLADIRFYYDWDWVGADQSYRRALALNRSFARARSQYSRYLAAAGRSQDAADQAAQAADLDPMSASAASTKALVLHFARNYDAALDAVRRALELEPSSAGAHFVLARIHSARGDLHEAIDANERAIELAGTAAGAAWRTHLVRLQALSGFKDEARASLKRLPTELAARRQRVGSSQFAFVYEALGDRGAALDWLAKAADERDPDLLWLAVDPRVDSLRSEPRFQEVLGRLGVPR
jgi:eukaryotic-like serine/threonine-protein kinase